VELDLDAALVTSIARLAAVDVPADDMPALLALLRNQVEMAATLRTLPDDDVLPITSMDPRWV
jgi:hypothetical protein